MKFTAQQEKAISGKGHALLVSAAAGSGKTAVLVERVLRYLTAEGGSVQRLIIMTYTKAAAEELRMKLKAAVDQYLRENGGNDHLMRQSTLIDSAEIGTIHSICLGLITRHFEQLDLDPRLRLIDETAEAAMVEEQAEALLEELYGSTDVTIQRFLECYATGRSDEGLKALLVKGMTFLDQQPLPEDFIERALAPYQNTEKGLFACFAEDGLYRYLRQRLEELLAQGAFYGRRVQTHPYMKDFPLLCQFAAEDAAVLDPLPALLERRDYDGFREALGQIGFARLNWKKLTEAEENPDAKEQFDQYRKQFKESVKAFCDSFTLSEAEELARIQTDGRLLSTYFSLSMKLRERLATARRKGGWISYQDMEQMAVRLLVEAYDPETDTLTATPLALQLRQDYDEIIIDEFQDANRAQDLIFRALSKEETNLFMVGDLKQSIYRFRGAEPEIFDQKRKNAKPYTQERLTEKTVLELNANFRSHPGVLRFANRVFSSMMRPALGGVVYDEREQLVPRREYAEPQRTRAEIHWLEPQLEQETGRPMERDLQNARYAAQLIAKAVREQEELLLPDGGRRPVEYGDFAILLRTVSHTAPTFERALREAGIPVTNRNEGDRFFDLFEVQSILSYLLVLNNPYDDVALVSLLYGDYFRFTVGELAGMRHRYTPLYEDLKKAAETLPKAKRAYETIEGYRKLAGTLYVYDLLYRIYQESGIFGAYAAEEGGAEKCANLELLAEDARLFEQEGYRGLYAFVQHIRISRERTQSGARLQNERNSVQIMSIHKSKGLQFPICILGDCQKKISTADGNEPILLHPRYGAAAEHPEPELYSCLHSLAQTVLADQITADGFSEEERVLYVALTRAESKVLMLINADRKSVENWAMEGASFREIPDWAIRSKGASYGKWLITLLSGAEEGAALRAECALPPLLNAPPLYGEWIQGTLSAQEEQTQATAMPPKPFDREAFRQRLDWVYPHLTAVGLPAKLSVSELKGIREAEEDAQPLLEQQIQNAVPRFAEGNKPRGNDVGNALHQALQFCDFTRLQKNPEEELARLVAEDFISEKQRALIPVEKIRRFTQSDCFEALMSAETYYKEERFLFPMPAAQLFGAQAEGEILIQGVLDCYWVEGDRAVILDYKTDRVQDPQELIDRYRVQMDLYEEALKRVRNLTVIRREIYSFSLEKTIIL